MNYKNFLAFVFAISASVNLYAESEHNKTEVKPEFILQTLLIVENKVPLLQQKVLLNYFKEIKGLERTYITNRAEGDLLIKKIVREFDPVIKKEANQFCQERAGIEGLTASQKNECTDFFHQMFVAALNQKIQQQAAMRSSVYQELKKRAANNPQLKSK